MMKCQPHNQSKKCAPSKIPQIVFLLMEDCEMWRLMIYYRQAHQTSV